MIVFLSLVLKASAQGKDVVETVERPRPDICDPKTDIEDRVFTKVEVPASFPGGIKKWLAFAEQNLSAGVVLEGIPDSVIVYKDSATVKFIVTREGRICRLVFLEGVPPGLRNAVSHLLKTSPKWIPASFSGRNVDAYYNLKVVVVADRLKMSCTMVR